MDKSKSENKAKNLTLKILQNMICDASDENNFPHKFL